MIGKVFALWAGLGSMTMIYGQSSTSDFETGYQGWVADFADYNVGDSAAWHLASANAAMPGITPQQKGLDVSGDNMSDDLFLFIKKKMTGLKPNTSYTLNYSIDIVTDMAPDGAGGGDLMLKAGATLIEPNKVVQGTMYRTNINKGNQSQPGPDMDTLGHINHNVPGDFNYHLVKFTNAKHPFKIKTDASGEVWMIIGGESAFEIPGVHLLIAGVTAEFSSTTGIAVTGPSGSRRSRSGKGDGWPEDPSGRAAKGVLANGRRAWAPVRGAWSKAFQATFSGEGVSAE